MAFLTFPVNESTHTGVIEITPEFLDMVKEANEEVAQDADLVFVTRPWPVQIYIGEWAWYNGIEAVRPCPTLRADRAIAPVLSFWGDGKFEFVSDLYDSDDPISIGWVEAKACVTS